MKKIICLSVAVIVIGSVARSQRNRVEVQAGIETSVLNSDYKLGIGGFVKGLYRLNSTSELSLSIGISRFGAKYFPMRYPARISTTMVPVIFGWRKSVGSIYLEPQAGLGDFRSKVDIGGDYARYSTAAFYWAVGGGYEWRKFSAGLRIQALHSFERNTSVHERNLGYVGINIAYRLGGTK